MIKIMLVDDHPMILEGLGQLFAREPDMQVCAQAGDGQEAVAKARIVRPDVVLMDISLPKLGGLEAIRTLCYEQTAKAIVVYTMSGGEKLVLEALNAGARGYVLKGADSNVILQAVRATSRCQYYLCPLIGDGVIKVFLGQKHDNGQADLYGALSDRERQVLRLLVEGHATTNIAAMLCVSPKTVEKHRVNLMKKLQVPDLIGLVKYAMRTGIIDPVSWKE